MVVVVVEVLDCVEPPRFPDDSVCHEPKSDPATAAVPAGAAANPPRETPELPEELDDEPPIATATPPIWALEEDVICLLPC